MNVVKVSNLINGTSADYKTLFLDKIVGGKQVYPTDKNEAYLYYDGEVAPHKDITVITETVYNAEVARINALPKPLTDTDRIKDLEETMAAMLMGGVV